MAINESPFSPVLSITIDKTPPPIPDVKVELASSTDFGKPKITFSSANSNISHYTVNINGEDKGIQTSPYNPVFTPLSINTIIITAYDIAGNSSSRTVKYPPVVNITASTIYSNSVINDSNFVISEPIGAYISSSTITASNPGDIDILGMTCNGLSYSTFFSSPKQIPDTGIVCSGFTISTTTTITVTATLRPEDGGTTGSNTQYYKIDTTKPSQD